MNALVTGGTGFLGKRVVVDLLARGAAVCCLVRHTSRDEDFRALPGAADRLEVVPGALTPSGGLRPGAGRV